MTEKNKDVVHCNMCHGSGEGYQPNTTCYHCKGKGEVEICDDCKELIDDCSCEWGDNQ